MDDNESILQAARAAFDAGRIAETSRLLASLPETPEKPWEAYLLGGVAARLEENHPAALKLLARAAALAPSPELAANAWGETARVYGAMDDAVRARTALDRALQINPYLAPAWVDRAALALAEEPTAQVEAFLERARALGHKSARFHEVQAQLAIRHRRHVEATEHYRKAREMDPRSLESLSGIASVQAMHGELTEAEESLEALFDQAPLFPACRRYANLHRFEPDDSRLAEWLGRLAAPEFKNLSRRQQEDLLFACAKALDDVGDYPRAFECLARGNALHRAALDYDVTTELEGKGAEWSRVGGELLTAARRSGEVAGASSTRLIFIVGLPRSGSTLLEQMLAGHSRVKTIGETGLLNQGLRALTASGHGGNDTYSEAELVRRLAVLRERYLHAAEDLAGPGLQRLIVDKSIENFWYAGLVKALFPDAILIHIKRDPMDTCFGCYRQLFVQFMEWSYRFDELTRYYRGYGERMRAWAEVSPGCVRDLYYERLVENPRRELTTLFTALDLTYEDSCLDFAKSNRFVPTLSQVQVREPVNRSGIGRWRRYEKELAPLRDALGDLPRRYAEELAAQES
ncbi:MAG: sulfotransferase [Gammaproteobacteria bacterium]